MNYTHVHSLKSREKRLLSPYHMADTSNDTHSLTESSQKPVRRMSTLTPKFQHVRFQPASVSTGPLYLLAKGCLYAQFLEKKFFFHKRLHLKGASHCHPIFTPGTHPSVQTSTARERVTMSHTLPPALLALKNNLPALRFYRARPTHNCYFKCLNFRTHME